MATGLPRLDVFKTGHRTVAIGNFDKRKLSVDKSANLASSMTNFVLYGLLYYSDFFGHNIHTHTIHALTKIKIGAAEQK